MRSLARFAPFSLALACALLPFALSHCGSGSKFVGECVANDSCPVGSFCKKARGAMTGVCACRTDEGCSNGEICNSQNVCQARQACRVNSECPDSTFCDLGSGACIALGGCGSDVQCNPGQVCSGGQCVDGCYDSADCPLYSVCELGNPKAAAIGTCARGKCDDKTFCPYGQTCQNGRCAPETNTAFCDPCERSEDCGSADNYCLLNSSYDPQNPSSGSERFCGVGCTNEADCPSGYRCGGVILLTQNPCTSDSECGGNGRRCVLGEGDLRGFCTCVESRDCSLPEQVPSQCNKSCSGLGLQPCQRNEDCFSGNCVGSCQNPAGQRCSTEADCQPLEVCRPGLLGAGKVCATDGITPCQSAADCVCSAGRCVQTGRSCRTAADCDLACVDNGCVLGSACAPIQGLLCPDVKAP